MKLQYETPRLTVGALIVLATVIPILVGYFLVSGMASSPCYEGLCTTTITTSSSTTTVLSGVVVVSMPSGAGSGPQGAPGFAPDNITIAVGTTVVWENNDTVAHTATSAPNNGTVSSGNMPPGAVYNFTFTAPGTYNIICLYHPWMKQQIKVVAVSPTKPSAVYVSIPSGAGSGPQGAPGYSPDTITVTVGTTVVWTNNDTVAHTVTSVAGNGSLSSGNLNPGASYNFTFTAPGTYDYICVYHSWMKGTVVVTPSAVTTVSSSTSTSSSSTSTSSSSATSSSTSITSSTSTSTTSSSSTSTTSSSSTSTTSSTSTSAASTAPTVITVSMPLGAGEPSGAPGYKPDKIVVVIGVNNTVTWVNNDTAHHTVTSSKVPTGAKQFNSGDMGPGAKWTYTFTVPGTYQYYCIYHAWMTGTVTVVQG